jgi:hypothetical protein
MFFEHLLPHKFENHPPRGDFVVTTYVICIVALLILLLAEEMKITKVAFSVML